MKYLFLFFTLAGISCTFYAKYNNRIEDKNNAEQITEKFHEYWNGQNFKSALSLFDDGFFVKGTKNDFLMFLDSCYSITGKLITTTEKTWQTSVTESPSLSGNYLFVYDNTYSNIKCKETIGLTQKPGGIIKIIYYHIDFFH